MKQAIHIEKGISNSGIETLKINEYYIHSRYNPIQEAERFVGQFYKKNHKTILFGFGLGYIAEEIKAKMGNDSDDNLFIIDPIKEELVGDQLNQFFNIYPFENLKDMVKKIIHIDVQRLSKINVICSPNYDKLFPKEYLQLLQEINHLQHNQLIEMNTAIKLSVSWQENIIKNRFHIVNDQSLNSLRKKINYPVVLVSGGPSLDKQLKLLKKFEDSVLIVVAGSAIGSIAQAGIKPDLVVSIDPKKENLRHYQNLDLNGVSLIYMPQNYYEIRDLFNSAYTFLHAHDKNYKNYLVEKFNKDLPLLGYGGSVANYAFAIISFLTDSPIGIIGQDLAYTNGQSHSIGNKNLWQPTENTIKERGLFYTEGYDGEEVLTSPVFFGMKQTFEELKLSLAKDLKVYNCTEGGIKLDGFEQMPFEDFCKSFCNKKVDKSDLYKPKSYDIERFNTLISEIENEKNSYLLLNRLLTEGIQLLKMSRNNGYLSEQTNKKLKKIENQLSEIMPGLNMDKLLNPISIKVNAMHQQSNNETEDQKFQRILSTNIELYKGIIEAIEKVGLFNNELAEKIQKYNLGVIENEK